jgi:parallel beta-helix repeat protein
MSSKNRRDSSLKTIKVLFLVLIWVLALCAVNTHWVQAQEDTVIYILSDGSLYSSTGTGAAIEKEGNVYTIKDDLVGFSLVVQCPNVVIDGDGFSLSGGSESAIDLSNINGITIKNIKIIGSYFYGILMMESSGITVEGSTIGGNVRGLYIYNASGNTFAGNSIINNEIGVDVRSSRNIMFRNNNFNNQHNLVVYGDLLSHFAIDIDTSNTVDNKKVYYLNNQENLVISPSTYPDVGILALVDCNNITIQDLQLTSNGQGIILAFTTNSKILRNTITSCHNGILLFSSSNNELTDNIITETYRAVQISRTSKNNRIDSNNIANNEQGILLFDSTSNTFIGNYVENNSMGIGFSSSSNNMIRGNYFINNEQQVYDTGMTDSSVSNSTNYWYFDYPVGGNYWSDYSGVDLMSGVSQNQEGSDTFGDTQYFIYGNNKDQYPLLPYGSPFGVSIISPENKTYNPGSITLKYTVTDTGSSISYSLDGQANVTISGSTTLPNMSEGTHNVKIYAKDTDGTEKSDTVYFTISKETQTPTDNEETEELPITLIAAAILLVAAVAVALLYFLKLKK